MPGKRGSISKILASTVDTGEAERLLTTAMATSETLSGYTKDEVLYTLSYHTLPRHNKTHVVHPPRADQVGLIADNMSIVNFESAQDVMREGEPGTLLTHS